MTFIGRRAIAQSVTMLMPALVYLPKSAACPRSVCLDTLTK